MTSKKSVKIGKVTIGGGKPVAVQSMTNTITSDIAKTVAQIKRLEEAGCQIVRVAIPDEKSARAIKTIKEKIKIPLIADIHFNYKLALLAIEAGADKIRINPGNISHPKKLGEIIKEARKAKIPIRIGVNSGSLERDLLKKHKHPTAKALVESLMRHVRFFEKHNFKNLVLSIKSTSVTETIEAHRLIAKKTNYPLHIGITEAGIPEAGAVKSAVGIGVLLAEGIGDTIRVSLTADPVEEVRVGYEILKALGLYQQGADVISCPTCGRMNGPVEKIAREIYRKTRCIKKPLKIAVMGCEVNGPGEAKEADLGLACGPKFASLFKKGKVLRKVPVSRASQELLKEIPPCK
ncbi:MAG: flavodoxin-dependent (E)-4-hydroxy-3-methylbut-2-enyl-diphosphate synthase [Candidatus Margulisbacteria bacterium]|nr:flavodoxin-dependent (E)-4-hydroxy-3-methylbut-2-enyl-diphosphate synthase [Candidatus Margulisiibacteriota bacterium]MBU1022542.1 flavodoxin-dependent (E)-4-hydroxy-3-methylbut-2-enyl-diphosphate synthase [Candidatus Margulisiibacteriota bacterium]MBU1728828.1 flavodoxin-dependent (E)-4-hydroxy-3-methylbut-2-enyl-diphosphate synthase [Candidatus Margulisiibacteriota bacterium]MBU1955794.1 flavodoxin-dependent (E)-4-hydroxy-3-methylbut-2-enyl-diphosphate synthase [Candidatus Margulisiibacteri